MKNFKTNLLIPTLVLMTSVGFGYSNFVEGQSQNDRHVDRARQKSPGANKTTPPQQAVPANAAAEKDAKKQKKEPTQFLRVTKDAAGNSSSLQTAITRYRPKEGELVVDLVGAVHIGELDYYAKLNRQFEHYDVVLYELVAPQGTRIKPGQKKKASGSPLDLVGYMQRQAQSTLGLASQLEKIDYQKKNFSHADLSPAQMAEKMAERGDTPLTLGLSAISEMMRQQNKAAKSNKAAESSGVSNQLTTEGLFSMINDPLKMKIMMANQFTQSGVLETGLGASLNQLIVTDRNVAALQVLQKEIVKGKKKIAIFYGAAHMPDFEKRLDTQFGLKKTQQVWLDAWDLTKAGKKPATSGTTKMLFKLLDELGK